MSGSSFNAANFLDRLTEVTKANLNNSQFGVSELAREMGMSRSNLHLRVKKLTKKSASQFINQVRLEKAMEILQKESLTISETAFDCGFQSVSYFTKCFHDYYGYPPGKVGNRAELDTIPELTSVEKLKEKKWLISAVVALLFLLMLLFVTQSSHLRPLQSLAKEDAVKNIAVLPMHFEGSDSMKLIAGGFRELLLNNLMEIENLRIRPETSVEQYRESIKPIKEIAGELNVDYIIEMKGFQKGNEPWLQVNLADAASDAYLLRESYRINIFEGSFLNLQSQIALEIIKNTQTNISTGEKEILEERLTASPAALNFYLQGLQHLVLNRQNEIFRHWNESIKEVFKAKEKFKKAIKLDSNFTAAYVQLGHIYTDKLHHFTLDKDLKYAFLDSGLVLAEKALFLYEQVPKDRNYHWALGLKGNYYYHKGDIERFKMIYEQKKKLSVIKDKAYYIGLFYDDEKYDNFYGVIDNFFNYLEKVEKNEVIRPQLYAIIYHTLIFTGFPEVAEKYMRECLTSTDDSLEFYSRLSYGSLCTGNFEECIKYGNLILERDSSFRSVYLTMRYMFYGYILLNDYISALHYARHLERWDRDRELIGFIYSMSGNKQKGLEHYSEAIVKYQEDIDSRSLAAAKYESHLLLSWTYSAMGEKKKALKYLKEVKNRSTIPLWIIVYMEDWPLFDNIRNEPEFQKLKKEFEKKYQKEHNRVARLLREKGEITFTSALN